MIARIAALLTSLAVLGLVPVPAVAAQHERAVLAGGCFWGMEAVFESLRGVTERRLRIFPAASDDRAL